MKATLEEVGDRSARTHTPLKNKIQKTGGRETHAREVKGPSPSMGPARESEDYPKQP